MKSNIFCTMVFILTGNLVFAQTGKDISPTVNSDYWNLTFSMGLTENIYSKNLTDAFKPGLTYNFDVSLIRKSRVGFFMNYSVANFSGRYYDDLNYRSSGKINMNSSQFTIGPRIYSNNRNSFIDAGLGYFNVNKDRVAGATVGVGGKFGISEIYSLSLGGRFSAADVFDKPYTSYTIYAGLGINNRNEIPNADKVKNRISIGAFAGSYGKSSDGPGDNSFSAELSYGIGKQAALLLSYLYSNLDDAYSNNSGQYVIYSKQNQSEITGGVRLYMKGNNIRLFMEFLTGAYLLSNEIIGYPEYAYSYSSSNSYYGLTFGGGVEFKLIDNLSGLVKTNVSNYIGEGAYYGLSGGLKYGL